MSKCIVDALNKLKDSTKVRAIAKEVDRLLPAVEAEIELIAAEQVLKSVEDQYKDAVNELKAVIIPSKPSQVTKSWIDKLEFVPTGLTYDGGEAVSNDSVLMHVVEAADNASKIIGTDSKQESSDNWLRNNAAWLLGGTKGKRRAVVAGALYGALLDYVNENYSELSKVRNEEELADQFGLVEFDTGYAEAITYLQEVTADGGVPLTYEASKIGRKVLSNLGIKTNQLDEKEVAQFELSVGTIAVVVGGELGWFKKLSDKGAQYDTHEAGRTDKSMTDHLIVLTPEVKKMSKTNYDPSAPVVAINEIKDRLLDFDNKYGIDTDSIRKPSLERADTGYVGIRRNPYTQAKSNVVELVEMLDSNEHSFNDGMEYLESVLSQVDEGERMGLLEKWSGAPADDPENTAGLPFQVAEGNKSKLNKIRMDIQGLFDWRKEVGDKGFFYDHFIARQDRVHVSQNVANTQNDKQWARWLSTPTSWRDSKNANISPENLIAFVFDVLDTNGNIDALIELMGRSDKNMHHMQFLYAIAQGMNDFKYDNWDEAEVGKSNYMKVVNRAKQILETPHADVAAHVLANGMSKGVYAGHVFLTLANVKKFQEAGSNYFVDTTVYETDGLTNGIAFKMMQYPVGKERHDMIRKMVGIRDANDSVETMAEVGDPLDGSNPAKDIYTAVGTKIADVVKSDMANNFSAVSVRMEAKRVDAVEIAETIDTLEGLQEIGGLLNVEDQAAIRKFGKSPTMLFGYSAKVNSIVRDIIDAEVEKLLIKVVEKKKGNYVLNDEQVAKVFGLAVGEVGKFRENVKSKSTASKELRKPISRVREAMFRLYREPVDMGLTEVLGPWVELNDRLNAATELMYSMFVEAYKHKIMDLDGDLTLESKKEIVRELAPLLPALEGYKGDEEHLLLITKEIDSLVRGDDDLAIGDPIKVATKVSDVDSAKYAIVKGLMKLFKAPGAAVGAMSTHSMDSNTQGLTIKEVKEQYGVVIGNLFDANPKPAWVDSSKAYNRNFTKLNVEYSVMDDLSARLAGMLEFIDNSEDTFGDTLKIAVQEFRASRFKMPGQDKDVAATADYVVDAIRRSTDMVRQARAELFSKPLKVGQMDGVPGSMEVVTPEQMTEWGNNAIMEQISVVYEAFTDLTPAEKEAVKDADPELFDLINKLSECSK